MKFKYGLGERCWLFSWAEILTKGGEGGLKSPVCLKDMCGFGKSRHLWNNIRQEVLVGVALIVMCPSVCSSLDYQWKKAQGAHSFSLSLSLCPSIHLLDHSFIHSPYTTRHDVKYCGTRWEQEYEINKNQPLLTYSLTCGQSCVTK